MAFVTLVSCWTHWSGIVIKSAGRRFDDRRWICVKHIIIAVTALYSSFELQTGIFIYGTSTRA